MLRRALLVLLLVVIGITSVGCVAVQRINMWRNRMEFSVPAFMEVVRQGNLEQVRLYLNAGMALDVQDENGYTPIIVAAEANQIAVVDFFIEQGVSVDQRSADGWTALHLAAAHGNPDMVKHLIALNADVNAKHNHGSTPLLLSMLISNYYTIEALLDAGAQVDLALPNGATPLILVSQLGELTHVSAAELLIKRGANKEAKMAEGFTALMVAVQEGHFDMTAMLLEEGADPNAKNDRGATSLIVAIEAENAPLVGLLCSFGADVNVVFEGVTALNYALGRGQGLIAEIMVGYGAR